MESFLTAMRDLSYIPPGFGFKPTDQQLLYYYLTRKINGEDMDDIIPEADVFKHKPSELLNNYKVLTNESMWYFFTYGSHLNQHAKVGYWRHSYNKCVIKHRDEVVGSKLPLVFLEGQFGSGKKTEWAMEQYQLKDVDVHSDTSQIKLCRIYKKELEELISDMPDPEQMDTFLNAMRALSPIPPGFGFNPTDQQLLCYYLKRKVHGEDMHIIPVVDIFNYKPSELREMYKVPTTELRWHFFKPGSHHPEVQEWGCWKRERSRNKIWRDFKVLGTKLKRYFYSQWGNEKKTELVMYEYYVDKDQCEDAQMKLGSLCSMSVDTLAPQELDEVDRFSLCLVVTEMKEGDKSVEELRQWVDGLTAKSSDPTSIVECIEAAPEPRPDALSEGPEDGIPSLIQEENKNRLTKEERSSLEMANFSPKDGQIGQSENTKNIKGKEVTDKSIVRKRPKREHGGRSLDQS